MPYTRKDLHKDIDELLDRHHMGEELTMNFGKIILEIQFQNNKVETRFKERESTKERVLA